MPRTRTELERDAKVDEIVEAAVGRLREGGYDALSVAGVARELGLAQNAVYWYFPSKDHLFVAAVERMLRDVIARKPPRRRDLERRVLWFVEQLDAMRDVRAAMYERARTSEVVATFAGRLQALWRRMLANVLSSRVPEEDLETTVEALLATIQGVLLEERTPAERARVVSYALRRLVPGATD
ncbi:MAG TPA: helix-turn-helix domain-containing protein [Solirubrobacteraceae bacterium]|nr:helix-turn-helix domain-containing protein [Solirubrobacteraceae bacterium]